MSASQFYGQSESEQIGGLEKLAHAALKSWSLAGAIVRPIAYRENMTFEVDAGSDGRFALRVHQAGYRTNAQVQSELDYMDHLRREGILTPEVVRAADSSSFIIAADAEVPEPRQCDLFEWIDGSPVRKVGEPVGMSIKEAAASYVEIGRLSSSVFNASEKWTPPAGFERPCWDTEGIIGVHGNLGDFRLIAGVSAEQRQLLCAIADRVSGELADFGKDADRYGLCQADLLPENVMVCEEGLRLIDFDDAGDSWILLDVVTSVWDLKLMGSEYYEPCLESFVEGFRQQRALPDEHLALIPTFLFARVLSYLAHSVSRSHLEGSAFLQQLLLSFLETNGGEYVRS